MDSVWTWEAMLAKHYLAWNKRIQTVITDEMTHIVDKELAM